MKTKLFQKRAAFSSWSSPPQTFAPTISRRRSGCHRHGARVSLTFIGISFVHSSSSPRMAATMHSKINRKKQSKLNIIKICEEILNPAIPMALRLSGVLMGGVVIVYERKVKMLYDDVSRLLVEINEAWKVKSGPDPTMLPKGKSQANTTLIGDDKIGVLLLNLGGPETLEDVQPFLFNLFADPDIIRLPRIFSFLQKPLAQFVSVLRAPKSREGYASIGSGYPLRHITDAQAEEWKKSLSEKNVPAEVYVGMRYWHPFTEEAIEQR
ncbi:ferrochelatase-2, chloroplastic [Trifolium repens]|nr:ferrochelatase-2, chloroplastic [Trifolium repens]